MFEEVQFLRKSKSAKIIFALVFLIQLIVGIIIFYRDGFTDRNSIYFLIGINAVILLVPGLIIYFSKLETKISKDGIHYRYPIFANKEKFVPWSNIETYQVRKYSPLKEFGGWGYRRNIFRKTTCLNVSGNIGFDVKLKSGQKLMIGTQKESFLRDTLAKLNRNDFG